MRIALTLVGLTQGGELADALQHGADFTGLHEAVVRAARGHMAGHAEIGKAGEHQHPGPRREGGQLGKNLKTVHLGENQIHRNHVGIQLADQGDSLLAVAGGAHQLHVRLLRQSVRQEPAELLARIRNQNLYRLIHYTRPFLLKRHRFFKSIVWPSRIYRLPIIYHNQTANARGK